MLKRTAPLMLFILLSLLTGCFDNRPVANLSVVTGVGIDRSADGKIEITVQLISKSGSKDSNASSSSMQSGNSTVNVSAEGTTISEAISNLVPNMGERLFFSHVQLLAIGESAAKEGLEQIWDFLERDNETGKEDRVVIVKNGTAKSVLEAKVDIGQIGAVTVAETLDNKDYGKNVRTLAFQVTALLSQPLTGIVTGVIEPGGATSLKEMNVEGGAVFKHGKLAGYLGCDETRGYLFASNKLKGTILTIANPKEAGKLVSIEIIRSTGTLTAEFKDGKPQLGIRVTAMGNISNQQGGANLTEKKEIEALQSEAEALITDNIRAMLNESQKDLKCDILNFNDLLYKHHYRDFEDIKDSWETLYSESDISISVDFRIDRPGVIKKPTFN